ncbi:MAG: mechanosensitive ion channel family protein [Muribaculaceae bacterium]|nr:mechanosensitive ion channel family protein [Muribaculaceae bacterium]
MDQTIAKIRDFLLAGLGDSMPDGVITVIILAGIALTACVAYWVCKGLLHVLGIAIDRTPTKWDDDLLDDRFMRSVSMLAPALVVNWLLPAFMLASETGYIRWIKVLTSFYILWAAVRIIVIFIGNVYTAMSHRKRTRPYAVKGIFQMLKLIIIALGVIVAISILIGKEPVAILTALGASAAILMLVFKDTILGLVASVQLTANKMVHRGDWIIADKHGINGEVLDVSLTTVKVRNWDNSVSTIPPYALITESFRNYTPMQVSGGRRVERSIYIDMESVGFLSDGELRRLAGSGMISSDELPKASRVVNLTLFRQYLDRYLSTHKSVNQSMTYMVRQMEPTPSGLPLQLYFFIRRTAWKEFETLQADIFDHVYAVVNEFGLRIYQTPSGHDLRRLGRGDFGKAN